MQLPFIKDLKYALACCCILMSSGSQAMEVDLELVLAMDASGSISDAEYILQLEGTAAAFKDPSIKTAILSGPTGRIAVNVMLWSDAAYPKVDSGWFILSNEGSVDAFAEMIRGFQVSEDQKISVGGGGTGIGSGIAAALKLIRTSGHSGLRKVVDVSGDGIETEFSFSKGILMPEAKTLANLQGVTVNGLPILSKNFPRLDDYYREKVITGPGSFVIVANNFADFARAIREKLWREIAHSVSGVPSLKTKRHFAQMKTR